MLSPVESRSQNFSHASIQNNDPFIGQVLNVLNGRYESAGRSDYASPWFKVNLWDLRLRDHLPNPAHPGFKVCDVGLSAIIVNPKATSQVKINDFTG